MSGQGAQDWDSIRMTDANLASWSPVRDSHRFAARLGPFVALLDSAFVLLFAYLRVWPLVATHLACVLFYLFGLRQSRVHPDRFNPMLPWIWFVVFVQSLLSVWMVGTEAGFQYYLLATIPSGFARVNRQLPVALLQTALIIVFFVACDIWLSGLRPLYPFAERCVGALRHINIVGTCAMLAAGAYIQARLVNESAAALCRIASIDALTGLLNRRSFAEIAEREIARSRRGGQPLSLALGDIDFFKRINDGYGHAAGDHVLQTIANLLLATLRDYDCVARWGGEEFIVLLPDTDLATAAVVVERLRRAIAESHPSFEGKVIPLTMTLGVAQFTADENWHAIVARADEALYRGKAGGRNRVETG